MAALTRTLIERTEGNPFFIEECVRTLVETGVVVGAASSYRLGGGLRGDLALPPTVQAVIAARVDRLSRDDRSVLHAAAAIGQDVPVAILRSITDVTGAAFDAALASLRRAELIHETRAYPDPEYRFKHALTHGVAYDSLLPELRRAFHVRIVDAIEQLYGDRLVEHVEQLVYHGARGQLWEKTARYAHEAGLKALDRSAHVEAIGHADEGLGALQNLPDTAARRRYELGLQITRGLALVATRGYAAPDVEQAYTRARALCEEVGDSGQLLEVLRGLLNFYLNRAQLETARELAERRLHLAQQLDAPRSVTLVQIGVGVVAYHMGDFRSALRQFERILALSDAEMSGGRLCGASR